jgi:hypothetical protein
VSCLFSARTSFDLDLAALAARAAQARQSGSALIDLTDANPTRCGLAPAGTLAQALAALARDAGEGRYEPNPRVDPRAREAIARHHVRRGAPSRRITCCSGHSRNKRSCGAPIAGSMSSNASHILFSNLKGWLRGTFHGVSHKHLARDLEEFLYRTNRRWLEHDLFFYILRRAVQGEPLPWARLTAEATG